jgi:hypothetical protein
MADPDLTIPDQSETTPYVPSSGTPPVAGPPVAVGSTDLPATSETTPYVPGAPKPGAAPATIGGVAAQFGRGAESAPYHVAGTPVDVGTTVHDVVNNPKFWSVFGPGVSFSDMPKRDQPVVGGSDWLMQQAGEKISPQLNPNNYPPQNEAERLARGAGDVGTQALMGRGIFAGVGALRGVPSSISIGRQLAGAGIGGAGGGAGSVAGRDAASQALNLYPNFRAQHPDAAQTIETASGLVGGGVGGLTGSGIANRFGAPGGAPAASQSPKELETIAKNQYTTANNIPANFTPSGVAAWANWHLQNLYKNYGSADIGPVVSRLNKLANPPANAVHVPLKELTSLDDDLGGVGKILPGGVDKLRSAAADTQRSIKGFIRNPPPGTIHSGDPILAAQTYKTADANFGAARRGQKLADIQTDAALPGRPSARAQVTNLVRPSVIDKQLRGFPDEDRQSLTEYAHGTPLGNALENFAGPAGGHGGGGAFGALYPVIEGAKVGGELGHHIGGLPGRVIGGTLGAFAYPTAKGIARRAANWRQPQLSPIIQQTMSKAPGYRSPTPASPFRTAVPVGLGALSGLTDQEGDDQ